MKENLLDYIFESHMADVYSYLLSICKDSYIAEEVMQETFFRAYLHFETCPVQETKYWLFRIAHNTYIDFRRKDRRSFAEEDEFFNNIADCKTTEDKVLAQEQLIEISYMLEKLPKNQKQAILLCDFNELSYKEAAEVIGVSLSHFKVLLFRGRQSIRKKVERGGYHE